MATKPPTSQNPVHHFLHKSTTWKYIPHSLTHQAKTSAQTASYAPRQSLSILAIAQVAQENLHNIQVTGAVCLDSFNSKYIFKYTIEIYDN